MDIQESALTVHLSDGIHELQEKDALTAAAHILREFHPAVEYTSLAKLREEGLRVFGLVSRGRLASVATVTYQLHVEEGRRAWVEDLITDPEKRSEGHGGELLRHVIELVHSEGTQVVMVQTRESNTSSHRFYDRVGGDHNARVYKWKKNA